MSDDPSIEDLRKAARRVFWATKKLEEKEARLKAEEAGMAADCRLMANVLQHIVGVITVAVKRSEPDDCGDTVISPEQTAVSMSVIMGILMGGFEGEYDGLAAALKRWRET